MEETVVDRITVAFEGDGGGTGGLSWGQLENWRAIVRLGSWLPVGAIRPLPPGTTVDDIVRHVQYMLGRYQTMRTRLHSDDNGSTLQTVYETGELTVEIVDAGDDDPGEVAAAVRNRYEQTPLDFATEWPVRIAVIRRGDALTHIVELMSHLVTDAAGADVMISEVAARETAPVQGSQPLEAARWQESPAGRRQNDAALRHWDAVLRTITPARFGPVTDQATPRFWRGEFRSPAMTAASRVIEARTRAPRSAIMLTAVAIALPQVTGIRPVAIRMLVSNRFWPHLARVVCTATQSGICLMDVAGLPFDEALARVHPAALTTYKYGLVNFDDVTALIGTVAAERGIEFELGCFINDLRGAVQPASDAVLTPPDAVLDRTVFAWNVRRESPAFEPMMIDVADADADDATLITIHIDTGHISPADTETFLRTLEDVLITAAT